MINYVKPTDGKVRSVTLGGADITGFVHCVRIFETLCKPYLTAQLILLDNDNIIENQRITGGEECTISFYSPPNDRIYDCTVYVFGLEGHQSPTNLSLQIYYMDLIGQVYYQDKANIVQHAFNNQGTAAIQEIWGKYLNSDSLEILRSSDGMLGKSDEKSQVPHEKPLAAIDKIRKYLKFGGQSSPTVFFRDRDDVKLSPLADLFGKNVLQDYIQKETWGADFFDPDIYKSIIVAEAQVDKNFTGESSGGRAGMGSFSKAAVQGQSVFDLFKGVPVKFAQAGSVAGGSFGSGVSGLGGVLGGAINTIAGGLGGSPNIQYTNSNRWDRGNAPDTKTMPEQMFAAEVKNGPQLKIKVPLQTGLEATVGKSVDCSLVPPVGDLNSANLVRNSMSGTWLVKDLCHELYTDNREAKGTTTMQLIRGGYGI